MNNINYFKSFGLILVTGNVIFATKLPVSLEAFKLNNSEMKLFEFLIPTIPNAAFQQVDKTAYNYNFENIFTKDISEFIQKFKKIYSAWSLDIGTLVNECKSPDESPNKQFSLTNTFRGGFMDTLHTISCRAISHAEMRRQEVEILVNPLPVITYRTTSPEGMMMIEEEIEQNLNGYFTLLTLTDREQLFKYMNQIVQHIITYSNKKFASNTTIQDLENDLEHNLKEVFKNLIDLFNDDKLNKNMELIAKSTFQLIEIPILFIYSRIQKELSIVDKIMKTLCHAYTTVCCESKNFNSFEAVKFLNAPDVKTLFLSCCAADKIKSYDNSRCK